jgi:hypothetical protein
MDDDRARTGDVDDDRFACVDVGELQFHGARGHLAARQAEPPGAQAPVGLRLAGVAIGRWCSRTGPPEGNRLPRLIPPDCAPVEGGTDLAARREPVEQGLPLLCRKLAD